ncbi:unannotated protein [freshwater metagenome]|uniref:Unannotated protein n=1 Tax=freshwater metagenome TaxID=449393 RepID=A0A6J7HPG9_9ZZZZ
MQTVDAAFLRKALRKLHDCRVSHEVGRPETNRSGAVFDERSKRPRRVGGVRAPSTEHAAVEIVGDFPVVDPSRVHFEQKGGLAVARLTPFEVIAAGHP